MATKWEGIRCKSYSLPGEGGELVISETIDRLAIEVSVRQKEPLEVSLSVRLNKEQFEALCNMNSAYDGLEITKSEPQPVLEEPETVEQ